jgi:hypothetical protein
VPGILQHSKCETRSSWRTHRLSRFVSKSCLSLQFRLRCGSESAPTSFQFWDVAFAQRRASVQDSRHTERFSRKIVINGNILKVMGYWVFSGSERHHQLIHFWQSCNDGPHRNRNMNRKSIMHGKSVASPREKRRKG